MIERLGRKFLSFGSNRREVWMVKVEGDGVGDRMVRAILSKFRGAPILFPAAHRCNFCVVLHVCSYSDSKHGG